MSTIVPVPSIETKFPITILKRYLKHNYNYGHRVSNISTPKFECMTTDKFEEQSNEVKDRLKELQDKYNTELDKSVKESLKADFNRLSNQLLNRDVINVSQLEFIKDFEQAYNNAKQSDFITDYVNDHKLRGLIDMFSKCKTVIQQQELIKRLVDEQLKVFNVKDMFKVVKEDFNEVLNNIDSFRIKFFNVCFDSYIADGDNKKLGCARTMYPYFDELFDVFIRTKSKDKMLDVALKGNPYKTDAIKLVDTDSFKGMDKDLVNAIKLVRTTTNCYEFLNKHSYDNLKSNYNKYVTLVTQYTKSIQSRYQCDTSIKTIKDFINRLIEVMVTLRRLDPREGITNTFNVFFINSFLKIDDIDINGLIKSKLIKVSNECALNKIPFNYDEHFKDDDFKALVIGNVKAYDINTYNKLGYITTIKQPKFIRIALGIRLVEEAIETVDYMRLKHNNKKFNVTIV